MSKEVEEVSIDSIVSSISSMSDKEDLEKVLSAIDNRYRRLFPSADFENHKLSEYIFEELARNNPVIWEYGFENSLVAGEGGVTQVDDSEYTSMLREMAKVISMTVSGDSDTMDLSPIYIKVDAIRPSDLVSSFPLYFMREHVNEFVPFLCTDAGREKVDEDKPTFAGAVSSYCTSSGSDIFDFCEMALEIIDSTSTNAEKIARAENHKRCLQVDMIRYILDNRAKYENLFARDVYFMEEITIVVRIGFKTTEFIVHRDMTISEK